MKKTRLMIVSVFTVLVLMVSMLSMSVGAVSIVTAYYDYDFDQSGDSNTVWTNKASSGKGFVANANTTGLTVSQTLELDPIRGNKALKLAFPAGSASGGLYRLGNEAMNLTGLNSYVTWYEFSFRFEGAITGINFVASNNFFQFTSDGELYIGGLKGVGAYNGTKVTNFTTELGKWYHLVMAVDFVDSNGTQPKLYAWMNGQLLETALTDGSGCSMLWSAATVTDKTAVGQLRCMLLPDAASGSTLWIDNVKMYTTQTKVAEDDFDPTDIFDGAGITSEHLMVDDASGVIYAPAGESLGGVSALLQTAGGLGYYNGAVLAEEDIVMTPAVGSSIYARSNSGVAAKEYTVAEGMRLYDYDASTITWKASSDGTTFHSVSSVSSLSLGNKLQLTMDMVNNTAAAQNSILVLAAYNGTALAGCSVKTISVPVGGATVTSELLDITDVSNLSVKAYIWKSEANRTTVMTSFGLGA